MKRLLVLLLISTGVLLFTGCTGENSRQQVQDVGQGGYPITIEDDLGRQVTIQEEPQRIVSLAPANTEILFALGLGDKVVGVTDYCDYPVKAQDKDKVGDFYGPSVEKTIALEPDVILATGGIQEETVRQLESLGQVVVALNPANVPEVMDAIELAGKVTGRIKQAQQITRDMRQRIAKVREAVSHIPEEKKPEVLVLVWVEDSKFFSAGPKTFVSSIVNLAGGRNVAEDAKTEYPQFSRETLMERDPEVIISTAHGYKDAQDVKSVLGVDGLKAIRNDRVYIVEDADLLTLPGPRIVEGLELTARFLHPDLFPRTD